MISKFVSAWEAGQVEAGPLVPFNTQIGLAMAGIMLVTIAGTDWMYSAYVYPWVLTIGLMGAVWITLQGGSYPQYSWLVLALPAAMLISTLVTSATNFVVVQVVYVLAILAFVTPSNIDEDIIKFAFVWAGRFFPPVCIALKFAGVNVNVLGLYCVIFAGVAIANKKIGLVVVYAGILLWLGGRSAIMAIAVMLMLGYSAPISWWVSAVIATPFLVALRPETIAKRFVIWADAINLFCHNPIFGIGPGGVMAHNELTLKALARQQVSLAYADNFAGWPRGAGNTLHAHNLILQVAVETGAVGLVALALAGAWLWWRWPVMDQWQRLIIIGVLVCGIMDYPFMLAGPTVLFALVAGYKRGGEASG